MVHRYDINANMFIIVHISWNGVKTFWIKEYVNGEWVITDETTIG